MNIEELSEEELFEGAVSDEPAEAETQIAEPVEPVRDEAGRFAKDEPKEEVVAGQVEKPAVDDEAAQVPSWRVREIREERDALKRQLDEVRARPVEQPKPQTVQPAKVERPDPLLDPDGYAKSVRDEIREELLNERRENSLVAARDANPTEFDEAYKAAQQQIDPALRARMQQSRDPGKTLMEWHRENKVKQEVGNDPNAWLEKKLEERLKDPAFLAKAVDLARNSAQPQANGRPRVELPPSMNGASRSNALLKSASNGDVSDDELFQELTG